MGDSATYRAVEGKAETYNVTGTLKVGNLDIEKIVTGLGAFYNPESSPSADVYLGGCLFRIFSTGTISCFGRSRERVTRGIAQLLTSLRKAGIGVQGRPRVVFHSEAVAMKLGKKLRLEKASYLLKGSRFSSGGPRSLIYRLDDPRTTLQLFEDGRITCLGARNKKESMRAYARIRALIEELGLSA